ncbi:IS21 family transposase [bacterium]|nr:MAG: IS21 family transposase [bacterium]
MEKETRMPAERLTMRKIKETLRKKGLTLFLLWEEYKARFPEGYHYSRFCDLYRDWAKKLDLSMRQEHRAGEKMFVDYAGLTVPVYDHGTLREAQIFVAVLGASSYAYAEATWMQTLPDWTASHVRAFEYFGGVTEIIVPDNLLSGVTRPCRYEPGVNATYGDLPAHYRTVAIPARIKKPRDKAKVEAGVLLVERWILARRSTIVSSQLPVSAWHEMIGDRTLADAILDRLVHQAYQLNLKGESMRIMTKPLTQAGH